MGPRQNERMSEMRDDVVSGPHGPIPIRRYAPLAGAGSVSAAPFVWVHGGAFVSGGLDQRETHEVAAALAHRGHPVVTVDYRLASRWGLGVRLGERPARGIRFPVPFDDVRAVVRQVQREARMVIVGGASAGACLAAATTLALQDAAEPAPRGVFLAYGTFHARLPRMAPHRQPRARGRRRLTHVPRLVDVMSRNYAGSRSALGDPRAFPGGHIVAPFPPTLMLDAEHDVMRASGDRFAEELSAVGTAVDYRVIPGTTHAFLHRPRDPGFAVGIDAIDEWITGL